LSGSPPPRPKALLSPDISDSIRIARVLGILGLVMIHVPPWRVDLGDPPRAIAAFDLIFQYCQELFGRASVPLLSIISGYLMVRLDAGLSQRRRLTKKVRSLLVPLVCWNLIAVLLGAILDGGVQARSWLQWADEIVALTAEPAIVPLYFLRDMFLCALLYPLLRALVDRWPVPTILVALALSLGDWTYPVFIGSGPFLFFTIGIGIALGRLRAEPGPLGRRLILIAALLAPAFTTAVTTAMLTDSFDHPTLEAAFTAGLFVERVCGAWATWLLAGWVLRRPWADLVKGVEPMIFLVFCSHVLWLSLAWHLLRRLGLNYEHPLYPLFFLTAPLHALAAGLTLHAMLRRLSPRLLAILCGGRMPSAKPKRPDESPAPQTS
jgi:fucose 4-O-acetylase-like acetyltransferase